MNITAKIEFPDHQLHKLAAYATRTGYMRVEPDKAWTVKEMKDAARFGVQKLVTEYLK